MLSSNFRFCFFCALLHHAQSGAWSKGANKAVSSAPPEDGFTTVKASGKSSLSAAAAASGRGPNSHRKGGNGGGGGSTGSNSNTNRRGSTNTNGYHNNNDGDSPGRVGGGRGGRGRGRGGRGRGGGGGIGRHGQDHRNNNNSNTSGGGSKRSTQTSHSGGGGGGGGGGDSNNNYQGRTERIIIKDAKLLEPGMGKTAAQKSVKRIGAKDFILLRTQYLEADPNNFNPHKECHWTDDDRADVIQALCSKVMELGDVSKNKKGDTAPPLEECAPLVVNEETRWKSKAMIQQSSTIQDDADGENNQAPETEEEIVGRALLILNKISWTTLERLTAKFVEETNLKESQSIRNACIAMLVKKAQTEQHFGPMYAELCAIISKDFKPFRKELLAQCQKEFEIDTAHKIANAVEGITDPEEIEYHSTLIRKAYIGHMTFLGELYLRDVVKLAVMMYCLDELLKDETDEENLECFVHLMTTMGQKLENHAIQNNKPFDWDRVRQLRQSPKINSRVKFLLQDLLELKERG
jgi:translation initiation factor 4G